jgi:hypothetical protein
MRVPRSLLALALLGLLLLTDGSGAASAFGGLPPAPQASISVARLQPIKVPQPAQRHFFSVFRTPPEGMPDRFASSFGRNAFDPGHRFNPRLAQRARPDPDYRPVWAIPGDGWICVFTFFNPRMGAGSVCGETTRAAHRPLTFYAFGKLTPGGITAGLVPDGVTAVHLAKSDLIAPVLENMFAGRGKGRLAVIRGKERLR